MVVIRGRRFGWDRLLSEDENMLVQCVLLQPLTLCLCCWFHRRAFIAKQLMRTTTAPSLIGSHGGEKPAPRALAFLLLPPALTDNENVLNDPSTVGPVSRLRGC